MACIGNSITDGYGIDMATQKGYPAILQNKLGDGYEVKNYGLSARTFIISGGRALYERDGLARRLGFPA